MKKILFATQKQAENYIAKAYPDAEKRFTSFSVDDFEHDESLSNIPPIPAGITGDRFGYEVKKDGHLILQVAYLENEGSFAVRKNDEVVATVDDVLEAYHRIYQLGKEEDAKAASDLSHTPADVFFVGSRFPYQDATYYRRPAGITTKTTTFDHKNRCGTIATITIKRIQGWERKMDPAEDHYRDYADVRVSRYPDEAWPEGFRNSIDPNWEQTLKYISVDRDEWLRLTTDELITLYHAMYERLSPEISPRDVKEIERIKSALANGKIWSLEEWREALRRWEDENLPGPAPKPNGEFITIELVEEYKNRFPEQLGLSKLGSRLAAAALRKKLGAAIHEARMAAGLTVRQLEERADTPKSNISRLEGGRANAGIDDYAKLAAALGLEINITPKQD